MIRFFIIAAFAACCLSFLLPSACQAQKRIQGFSAVDVVVFDNSREQFWVPFDPGFFGYSELTISLQDAGFLVTESNLPLTVSLVFEPRGSTLVMGPASGQRYSKKEIDAIVRYVNDGGGLLILAEAAAEGTDNFQNALASQFGIRFRNGSVVDTANSIENTAGAWIFAHSDVFGIERVSLPVAVPLVTTGSVINLLTTGATSTPAHAIIGAAVKFGKGRVACIGDSQFLVNGGKREIGIDCAQNRDFALALFEWLSGREKKLQSRIVPQYTLVTAHYIKLKVHVDGTTDLVARVQGGTIKPDTVRNASGELTFTLEVEKDGFVDFVGSDGAHKTIVFLKPSKGGIGASLLFDTRFHGPEMADPLNGLLDFAAFLRDLGFWVWAIEDGLADVSSLYAIVVVNPLRNEPLTYAGELDNPRLRWLIIGEPVSTISVHNEVGDWFRARQFTDRDFPVGILAQQFGIRFLPYEVYESDLSKTLGKHPTFPILNFGDEKCDAFRCGVLEADKASRILVASRTAWGLEGGVGVRAGAKQLVPGKYDYAKPPAVGILLKNTIVLSDLHLLTSQHLSTRGNWVLATDLSNWLAGQEFKTPVSEP